MLLPARFDDLPSAHGHDDRHGADATVRSLWRWAAGLFALGLMLLPLDLPVARLVRAGILPGEVNRLLGISEAFAHGWGVAAILLVAFALDPRLRHADPESQRGRWRPSPAGIRLVAMAVVGSLFVNVIKLVARRVRPRVADLDAASGVLATFDATLLAAPDPGSADLLSFPSGHAAAAAGLAAALSCRYPRGTALFVLFATLAALQRVGSAAHYPSDICCGAALGCLGAAVSLRVSGAVGREARLPRGESG